MSRRALADTGPLYAALDPTDDNHELGIVRAHGWLGEIQGYAALLNPTPEDYREAAERIVDYRDQDFSMFDALAAVVSEERSLPVWTCDHHFDVMGVEVWRGAS